jgi:hypothetical protein
VPDPHNQFFAIAIQVGLVGGLATLRWTGRTTLPISVVNMRHLSVSLVVYRICLWSLVPKQPAEPRD